MASWQLPRDPLSALRAGDPAPFEEFVRRRARTLIAYFRQRGATVGRAEDLTQEVFLKLHQCAAQYEPRERFAAYCFSVARNVWIDDCRRASARLPEAHSTVRLPERVSTVHEPTAPPIDPTSGLVHEEEERSLRELLSELSQAHRSVFELAVLGELSYAEIGALLSIPVGTVKSRMFHAVRHLRRAWAERREREGVA